MKKKTARSTAAKTKPLPNLDFVANDLRLVSLTFTITFFTDVMFSTIPDAVLACFDRFKKFCPEDQLKFYMDENMKEHKPVTPRALKLLETWLKPGGRPREFIALELTDGPTSEDAPHFKFKVWGNEPRSRNVSEDANFIHLSFPAQWGLKRHAEMLALVKGIAEFFPYQSALAGFGFQVSRDKRAKGETYAWSESMRHRGIDIFVSPYDTLAVGKDAIKGVNWLTVLGDPFVKKLGGKAKLRRALPTSVALTKVHKGLLLQAGPLPQLGDSSRRDWLPDYKAVYQAIAPLAERGYDRTIMFLAGESSRVYDGNTTAWQKRFA